MLSGHRHNGYKMKARRGQQWRKFKDLLGYIGNHWDKMETNFFSYGKAMMGIK